MNDSLFINKKTISDREREYNNFYEKGIELLQKYSGAIWSDFNIHDPGVTILEQLCYALSELFYKSTFPVEDYFTDKNNQIPFEKLGLLTPEQVIPNGCVTVNDFRKVIFDEVEEVGNIWLEYDSNTINGLYTVYIDIIDQVTIDQAVTESVIKKVYRSFAKWRSLNEDISNIIILQREQCDLVGEIEVHTRKPINELFAEIYTACSQYVTSNMFYRSVKELELQGMKVFEILNGPLLKKGIILDSDLTERSRLIRIPEMRAKIMEIEGVKDINDLYVVKAGSRNDTSFTYVEGIKANVIKIPENSSEIHIRIVNSGKVLTADFNEISSEIRKRFLSDTCYPDYLNDIKMLYNNAKGTYRIFNHYYSIQNHFPGAYGINAEGLPDSESADRKGRAKQLKAYLFLFEQIMADFIQSIQNIKSLFSTDSTLSQTYFFNSLDNSNIPDIQELYTEPEHAESKLKDVIKKFDNPVERRSEFLDFLLGIYGLEFKQISLRHFLNEDPKKAQKMIVRNKLRYLQYASVITLRLSKGINYLYDISKPEAMSGLELQTLLRTGHDPENPGAEEKMLVIEHILLRPLVSRLPKKGQWFYNSRISIVLPGYAGRYKNSQFKKLVMQIIEKSAPAHLFVEYIWCNKEQWKNMVKTYSIWIHSFSEDDKLHHDRISLSLCKLIFKYRKQS